MRTFQPVNDGNDIFCKKCQRHMARLVEGVLVASGIKIYNELKYFCATCGTPYYWREAPPPKRAELSPASYEVLHGLGRDE